MLFDRNSLVIAKENESCQILNSCFFSVSKNRDNSKDHLKKIQTAASFIFKFYVLLTVQCFSRHIFLVFINKTPIGA